MLHLLVPTRPRLPPPRTLWAIGGGRWVALVGADRPIDWWYASEMDSLPLFNRMHDCEGGRFSITSAEPFENERRHWENSNILEMVFITKMGRARATDVLNRGVSRRLPPCELARRIEGLSGSVELQIRLTTICARCEVDRADHPNAKIRIVLADQSGSVRSALTAAINFFSL